MRTKLSEDELLELNRRVVERPPRAAAVSRVSAEWAAIRKGIRRAEIVALSLFTTQSSSSAVEQIHRQIAASSVAPATFNIGPEGSRAYFPMNSVRSLAFDSQHTTDAGWVRIPTNMAALNVIPGAVGAVAYGRFRAPDYMRHPGEYIPETPTRTGTPAIQGFNAIDF